MGFHSWSPKTYFTKFLMFQLLIPHSYFVLLLLNRNYIENLHLLHELISKIFSYDIFYKIQSYEGYITMSYDDIDDFMRSIA